MRVNKSEPREPEATITWKQYEDYKRLMAEVTLMCQRAEMVKYQTLLLLNHNGLCLPENLIKDVKEEYRRLTELSDKFKYLTNLDGIETEEESQVSESGE